MTAHLIYYEVPKWFRCTETRGPQSTSLAQKMIKLWPKLGRPQGLVMGGETTGIVAYILRQ